MATIELEIEAPPTEEERVLIWRAETLHSAGFAPDVALELAVSREVDLHRAVGLLKNGCPPETARRILL